LAYLKHLGVDDVPISKDVGGEWIDRIHAGVGFTDVQLAHLRKQMESWTHERILKHPDLYPPVEHMKSGMPGYIDFLRGRIVEEKRKLKLAVDEVEKEPIREEIESLESEIRDEKESIAEDARDAKEYAKARIADLQQAMGSDGHFYDEIRKPTQAQVKTCTEELDRTKPGWNEEDFPSELCNLLKIRFPELVKTARPSALPRKSSKKQQPGGCAGVLVMGAFLGLLIGKWAASWFQ
jgi:hypothetical protein